MTPEWYMNDPQGLWRLLQHYLTAPFAGHSTDTAILSEFLESVLHHPLRRMVLSLFFLLLVGSLLAGGIAIACESRSKKIELAKQHFARHRERRETIAARAAEPRPAAVFPNCGALCHQRQADTKEQPEQIKTFC